MRGVAVRLLTVKICQTVFMKGVIDIEEWRPVKGYEGYYEVSNLGRVRGVERTIIMPDGRVHVRKQRIKSLYMNPDGYMTVKLSKDAHDVRRPVHRMVYESFIGDIPDGMEINHMDFNRTNNTPDNLEVLSHIENIRYTIDAGRHCSTTCDYRGEKNPNFGNRSLSKKYADDPELSREKQGRPGLRNGRCRKIMAVLQNGQRVVFDYISACADYIIQHNITHAARENVISAIITAARKQSRYHGMTFEYL